MKNIIIITVKLLVITIIAGAVLGVVNAVTAEPIAEQAKIAADNARKAAFPEASAFEEADVEIPEDYAIIKNVYNVTDDSGNVIGIVAGIVTKGL